MWRVANVNPFNFNGHDQTQTNIPALTTAMNLNNIDLNAGLSPTQYRPVDLMRSNSAPIERNGKGRTYRRVACRSGRAGRLASWYPDGQHGNQKAVERSGEVGIGDGLEGNLTGY